MGSDNSRKFKSENLTSFGEYYEARNKYQARLFLKKKKTSEEFTHLLESIYKRSTYLKYKWAQQLCSLISKESIEKLYLDYQKILKQNCSRLGKNQKTFCPNKIRKCFLKSFQEKYGKDPQLYTSQDISDAFEECKSYFMVIAWNHQIVTINDLQSKENSQGEQFQYESQEEQVIYKILSQLISHDVQVNLSVGKVFGITKILDQKDLVRCTKLFKSKLSFREKQNAIKTILNKLEALGEQNYQNNVHSIVKFFGVPQSYSLIKIIHEIGTINVDKIWAIIKNYRDPDSNKSQ